MQYRTMGTSDLTISAIGFGCWEMGGNQYGDVDDQEEMRAVHRAIDLGVTLFDTAAIYGHGHSEEVLGKALGARRKEIVLVTKGGLSWEVVGGPSTRDSSRAAILKGMDDSLRRLGTDYVDLYLIHWPDVKTPIAETMETLNDLVHGGEDALHRRLELQRGTTARSAVRPRIFAPIRSAITSSTAAGSARCSRPRANSASA